jgi:hypothetical protein
MVQSFHHVPDLPGVCWSKIRHLIVHLLSWYEHSIFVTSCWWYYSNRVQYGASAPHYFCPIMGISNEGPHAASSLSQHHYQALSRRVVPPLVHLHTGRHQACDHDWLQAMHDSGRPPGQASHRFWASCQGHLLVSEHHWCPTVPDIHSARHRLRRTTYLHAHARSSWAPSEGNEVHPACVIHALNKDG